MKKVFKLKSDKKQDMLISVLNNYCSFIIGSQVFNLNNVLSHMVIGLTVSIDVIVSAHHVDLIKDFIVPYTIAVSYQVFNFVYYLLSGTDCDGNFYVYSVMDWTNSTRAIGFCIASQITGYFMHVITYLLSKVTRTLWWSKAAPDRNDEREEDEGQRETTKIEV